MNVKTTDYSNLALLEAGKYVINLKYAVLWIYLPETLSH